MKDGIILMAVIIVSGFIGGVMDIGMGITAPVAYWMLGSIGGAAGVLLALRP